MEYINKNIKSQRATGAFRTKKDEKRYWITLGILVALGLLAAYGLLVYKNPVPIDSPSFLPVVKRRITAIISMMIAVVCQSLGTVAFQSITNNKIITPSLLGFEALYSTINTATMFFFGATAFISFNGIGSFLFQMVAMIVLSLILYGWLLAGKRGDLQLLLLVGVIIGSGLRSISSFMKKVLSPSEFDILQAKLFGSVSNADPDYFVVVIPILMVVAVLVMINAKKLNVLSLGKDVSSTLGVNNKLNTIFMLVLVSVLMSVSTALLGPLTFFGFLVATLTYQLVPTYDHRYIFPMSLAIGFLILTGAYFIMYHVFSAQGVVSIIIEMVGGLTFLIMLLRKGIL